MSQGRFVHRPFYALISFLVFNGSRGRFLSGLSFRANRGLFLSSFLFFTVDMEFLQLWVAGR